MREERRGPQELNLVSGVFNTPRGIGKRYNGSSFTKELSNRWARIRSLARTQDVDHNSPLHHLSVETLCQAYKALDESPRRNIICCVNGNNS